jgi:hypothetical protein
MNKALARTGAQIRPEGSDAVHRAGGGRLV